MNNSEILDRSFLLVGLAKDASVSPDELRSWLSLVGGATAAGGLLRGAFPTDEDKQKGRGVMSRVRRGAIHGGGTAVGAGLGAGAGSYLDKSTEGRYEPFGMLGGAVAGALPTYAILSRILR